MKITSLSIRCFVENLKTLNGIALTVLILSLCGSSALNAAEYSWSGGTSGNWSGNANWTPAGPPTSGDIADLPDTVVSTIVSYDLGASGTINTLNITEASGANNELLLGATFNVSNPITLSSVSGTATIDTQSMQLTNSTLTVGNGGQLLTGSTGQTVNGTFLSGNLLLQNGGVITTNSAVGSGGSTALALTVTGSYGQTGGTLNISQGTGGGSRFSVSGNFDAQGGTINFTGVNSNNEAALYLGGATNIIGSGVTLQNINGAAQSAVDVVLALSGDNSQSLTYATSSIFNVNARENSSGNTVKTITYNGPSTTGTIGMVGISAANAGSESTWRLGSNLIGAGGLVHPLPYVANSGAGTENFDLNGNTYDGYTNNTTSIWSPTNSTGGTDIWMVSSTTGTGTFKADAFKFSTAQLRIVIGNHVVLQAMGTDTDNFNLPTGGNSSISFDPGSLFYYTGSAATLTGTTKLGGITVGDGINPSTLTLSTSATTQNVVTINPNSTFVLGTNNLNTSGNGILIESGGYLNTSLSGSGVTTTTMQTLLNQVSSSSGSTGAPAFINLAASQGITSGSNLNLSALPNVSIGAAGTFTLSASAMGAVTPANGNYHFGSPTGNLTLQGVLLSGGTDSFEVSGTVNVGASNASYGGATVIDSGGYLMATNATRLPSATNMTIKSGGTFDLINTDASTTQVLASLSGGGTLTNNTVSATGPHKIVQLSGTANTTFSGVITDLAFTGGNATQGTIALTRAGTGSTTLSGSNSYSGVTTITSGTLIVANPQGMGSNTTAATFAVGGSSAVNLNPSATGTSTLSFQTDGAGNNGTIVFGPGNGTGYNIDLNGTSTATEIIDVRNAGTSTGNTIQLGQLYMNGGGNTATITGANGYSLNFGAGMLLSSSYNIANSIPVIVTGTFSLPNASTRAVNFEGSSTVTINAPILAVTDMNQNIVVSSGVVTLNGTSNLSGGAFIVNAGNLVANNATASPLGSNFLVLNSGTLEAAQSFTLGTSGTLLAPTNTILVDASKNLTVSGTLIGAGGLNLTGPGTLTLNGAGNHSGGTTVAAGTLAVNGGLNGAGAVSVTGGATSAGTLAGNGTIALGPNNALNVSGANGTFLGTIAPGAGTSTTNTLTVGTSGSGNSVIFGANSQLTINVGAAGASDTLAINGTLDLSGNTDTLTLNLLGGALDGSTYIIATFSGGFTNPGDDNVFDNVSANIAGGGYQVVYGTNDIELQVAPEPGATTLVIGALGILFTMKTLRRAKRETLEKA